MSRAVVFSGFPLFTKSSVLLESRARQVVECLLANADVGVVGFREVDHYKSLGQTRSLRKSLSTDDRDENANWIPEDLRELWLQHGTAEDPWELPPDHESAGTTILLARLDAILTALRRGCLLVVDEFDMSLHPDLSTALLALFTNEETNPHGAQLLFTTQDRSLLSRLRTDEVLLVDKGHDGASKVRAASDYRFRSRDDLGSLYDAGRLRGVPVLGSLPDIIGGFLKEADHGA